MAAKRVLSVVLLLFVATSLVYLVVDEWQDAAEVTASDAAPSSSQSADGADTSSTGHRVIAYYFHQTKRCATCLAMQRYAREALEDGFPDAIASGKLVWRLVNVEEPQHRHFATAYGVITSSLVLVETVDGDRTRWNNLTDIWNLAGNELEFKAYVEGEAIEYVEFGP